MDESKWIKQISKDNSIQLLLCEHFIHPTVNDCVIVGNSSFRLLILQSNQIKEVARYDHSMPIVSACITYNGEQPEIAFISGQTLYFLLPRLDNFEITDSIALNYRYSFLTSNPSLICLYPRESTITFYSRSKKSFTNFNLPEGTKIWSCAFLRDYIVTLEYQSVFKVKMYKIADQDFTAASTFVVNYYTPYKLVSVPSHSSVYLLCESVVTQFKYAGGWTMNKHSIGIKETDPLVVDAAPCGVRLFVLTAGNAILRFDGEKFEYVGTFNGAFGVACMAINRVVVAVDACRLKMCDASLIVLDEYSRAACFIASYAAGSFTTATQNSVHSVYYDYGIEVLKCAAVSYSDAPRVFTCKDCFFVLFADRTVVVDADFKDVTPSHVKRRAFDRVHANSRNSFFAATQTQIFAYEFGSLSVVDEASDVTSHRMNKVVSACGRVISLHTYTHSSLLKSGCTEMRACIADVYFADVIAVSLFNGQVSLLDSELCEVKCVDVGFVAFSIVYDGYRFYMGSGDGRIAYADGSFEKVDLFESPIGISTVHLVSSAGEVTATCDNRFFHISNLTARDVPADFIFFAGFCSPGTFLGLLRREKKGEAGHVVTARIDDRTHGFVSRVVFEFSHPVTKLCCARRGGDFVCAIGRSSLFWSRGSVTFGLDDGEEVVCITEWKARHSARVIQFWIVCTRMRGSADSRLIILNQSQSTNKVVALLKKEFKAPITAFAVSSQSLAFFSTSDTVTGISLETGSLTQKSKAASRMQEIVAIDASSKYVAALADKNEFALFEIVSDTEISHAVSVRRPGIFGRIKIIGEYVAVSSRVHPSLYVYSVTNEGNGYSMRAVRAVDFMSPVTSIFSAAGNAIVTCVCGEVFIVRCSSEGEVSDLDVSKLFSFSQSALCVYS